MIDALRRYVLTGGSAEFSDAAESESFLSLVRDTLALREYVHRVLDRQKDALAAAITKATGVPADDSCVILASDLIEDDWNNPAS